LRRWEERGKGRKEETKAGKLRLERRDWKGAKGRIGEKREGVGSEGSMHKNSVPMFSLIGI